MIRQLEFIALPPQIATSPSNLHVESMSPSAVQIANHQNSFNQGPLSMNVCMMCINNGASHHENPHVAIQSDFIDIKGLASRLIAAIHSDEVEKKLLRFSDNDLLVNNRF